MTAPTCRPSSSSETAPAHPRTRWLGFELATLSALFLFASWSGPLDFEVHGLDLGDASMVAVALRIGFADQVHVAATDTASPAIAVATANIASVCALQRFL